MRIFLSPPSLCCLAVASLVASVTTALGQSDPQRGLWVGQVSLDAVNEVPVPLDANNVPIAPDPNVPTPTADRAHLRVLLHVNGAGQVSLLRDVAILNWRPAPGPEAGPGAPTTGAAVESDLALVTDARLYGEFPPQPAVRLASAVFDFGDARATEALNEIVHRAAAAAAAAVNASSEDFKSDAGLLAARTAASTAASGAATPVVAEADAAEAFDRFLREVFTSGVVNAIADASDPVAAAATARTAAVALEGGSFYGDSRAVQMVDAVVAAVLAAPSASAKRTDAQNTAAAYADVADNYHRFIAGKVFGDMISGAAASAAAAAANPGATADSVRLAVNGNAAVVAARSEALTVRVTRYTDTRARLAVEAVVEAVLAKVVAALPAAGSPSSAIEQAALAAGRQALVQDVVRYPVSTARPSPAYTDFVTSDAFSDSVQLAAEAAANGAVSERANTSLYTAQSLEDAALVAAVTALQSTFAEAARANLTELPLLGSLGPGQGDPRRAYAIRRDGGAPLGPAGLSGEVFLPANHPTNPFRHRRNPDHATGFDITRLVRFDFDGTSGDAPSLAAFGVDRLTGTYREEIQGLHKPLGPDRDLGLKVEGRFELRRISLIDALNAR